MNFRIFLTAVLAATLVLTTACGPKSPADQLKKAAEKVQAGDLNGAIADVEKLKQQKLDDANWTQATLVLGSLYVRANKIDKAREQFREVVKRIGLQNPNPQLEQAGQSAELNVINSFQQTNQPEKALAEIEATSSTLKQDARMFSAQLTEVKSQVLAKMKRTDEAVQTMMSLADQVRDPSYATQVIQLAAQYYMEAGEWDKASDLFINYLKTHPNYPQPVQLYMFAGLVYTNATKLTPEQTARMNERMNEALKVFENGLENPSSTTIPREELQLGRATAMLVMKRNTEALDLLTSITQQQSYAPEVRANAMFNIGHYYESAGNLDKAKETFEKLAGEFPQAREQAMYALQILTQKQAMSATQPSQPTSGPASGPASAPAASPASAPAAAQ